MSRAILQRLTVAILALTLLALLASFAIAQPPGRWVKLAPFPEPAEELYGVAANGKLATSLHP